MNTKVKKISEDQRYALFRYGAWTSWWGAVLLLGVQISLGGARPAGKAPSWLGLIIVTLIGTGIASGMALSRMRLARTIEGVFQAGLRASMSLQTNLAAPAAIMEVSLGGDIEHVEHAEVIGWDRNDLIGEPLTTLIPDRYLRKHREGLRRFQESGETRVAGATLNVPVLQPDGTEKRFRLSVARMGAIFIGTLVPAAPMVEDEIGTDTVLPRQMGDTETWYE